MTGQEIIDWIQENHAEDVEIYVEAGPKTVRESTGFEVLWCEDCPCMDMIVLK